MIEVLSNLQEYHPGPVETSRSDPGTAAAVSRPASTIAKPKHTSTYVPALVTTTLLWVGLFVLGGVLDTHSFSAVALTWIICLCGNVLGVPLGILASPYEREGSHFQRLGALVATFFSGIVVSQLSQWSSSIELSDEVVLGRLLLFISFLVLGAIQTFVFRRYSDTTRPKGDLPPASEGAGPTESNR